MDESEEKAAGFNIIVAALVAGIMANTEDNIDEQESMDMIDNAFDLLFEFMDDDGTDLLESALDTFQTTYAMCDDAESILCSFDWHHPEA
jgi:hypothetical protein